jgi:hypothetical protein
MRVGKTLGNCRFSPSLSIRDEEVLDSPAPTAYSHGEVDHLQMQEKHTQENFRVNKIRPSAPNILPQKLRRPLLRVSTALLLAAPAYAHATPADQASSWWIAQREAQKAPATTDTNDQPPTGTEHSDDKATS